MHKVQRIQNESFQCSGSVSGIGRINNPGKHLFLELAADSVLEVNQMMDSSGFIYARK